MNGTREDHIRTGSHGSLDLSDTEGEDTHDTHGGDYSARFEELMSDTEGGSDEYTRDEDDEQEESFLYSGTDAQPAGNYREQLRDVLGTDHEDDELDEREVEHSLLHEAEVKGQTAALMQDAAKIEILSDHTQSLPSTPSEPGAILAPVASIPNGVYIQSRVSQPFLHPTISRLRSSTPQTPRVSSSGSARSATTIFSHVHEDASAPRSHFSALSRTSSVTDPAVGSSRTDDMNDRPHLVREVFRWTTLHTIGEHIYSKLSQKATSLLGTENAGSPTVLTANGFICVGTDTGRVLVFDFQQDLKCICGSDTQDRAVGPVTAVALSFDHTFVASGHASGHIQLFDLKSPKVPARFVAPTSLSEVASGRQEGHLAGSRIVSIGFVAGRHTAVVSADDNGMAFYHSLGKVFFMEASDTLRLLGKYPDDDPVSSVPVPLSSAHHFRRRKPRKASTILAMSPLPLGTAAHPTDQYNLIALLTPVKLVIVGLKPSPRTWYRRHREGDERGPKSKFKGTLAWYPSVVSGSSSVEVTNLKHQVNGHGHSSSNMPMLVYSWGDNLFLIRVSEDKFVQSTRNSRTGKTTEVEIGRVVFEESRQWHAGGDVLALQWLNVNQVLILTAAALEVYDVRSSKLVEQVPYDAWLLVSPMLSHTTNGTVSYSDAVMEVAHSVRVYKGKIFTLGQTELRVGTLLTWADRILSFVQEGDFLSAIELTRSYYIGDISGNRNGLPESPEKLKKVVGDKMQELMSASARYAFSEDRLTDGTHVTPDGRGVDRTSLFEGLVRTCTRACVTLQDYDFLFEDLFQFYEDNGITRIFLSQLEPFVLDGTVCHVPPRITQKLIALHESDDHPELAERIIWHIDPDCLDVNQAVTLCQRHRLYDALIYVFTRAMKDFVAPMVELLRLIRKVQQYRRALREHSLPTTYDSHEAIGPDVLNAYKIYPYLANTLMGVSYPSAESLPKEEAVQAKDDVYAFLFSGRSSVWPLEGGKLILTADEENGVEPTYPYARLLLRFDPEAFLHILDLAFEDAYLNDETRGISRLVIVKILLEILSSPDLSHAEVTFVNIFIARNVPKYPQFIQIPPSALHNILISLAQDPDLETREDRQLAAEYLLSSYTPHESDRIIALFENAGFYRILRTWYQHDHKWSPLLLTYLDDASQSRSDVFYFMNDVLDTAERANKGALPREVQSTLVESLSSLLDISVIGTAALLEKHLPALHERAFGTLEHHTEHDQFAYLRYLLGPPSEGEEYGSVSSRQGGPSPNIPSSLRRNYISLSCRFDPPGVIPALRYLPSDFMEAGDIVQICEEHRVFDAVIWVLNRAGQPLVALSKLDGFETLLSAQLGESLTRSGPDVEDSTRTVLATLEAIGRNAVSMCLEYSQSTSTIEVPLEDMWYDLLRCQIDTVQRVAGCCSLEGATPSDASLTNDKHLQVQLQAILDLRSHVQETFTSLMTISATRAVSLPRLFKRLLTSASANRVSKPTLYAEFRTLFTGMLESYRSDSDMLIMTKHLVDDDLFAAIAELSEERIRGWAPSQGRCRGCGESFLENKKSTATNPDSSSGTPIVVLRTGTIYHSRCFPPDHHANSRNVH